MASTDEAAIQRSEQGVPPWNAQAARDLARRIRGDDLKLYLAVCDALGFRAAALITGMSINTLRRRIERLEAEAGAPLLQRDFQGITPTAAGMEFLAAARALIAPAPEVSAAPGRDVLVQPDEIRIGSTEILGSIWLAPRLMTLQAQHPELTISLQHSYDAAIDRSRDVDVGLSFTRPENPLLACARLGTLHFMLFASPNYLSRFGQPGSFADLRDNHRFIEQAGAGLNSRLLDLFVGAERPPGFVPIKSNSAMSVYWAVIGGAGVGVFPTFACAISDDLVPLDLSLPLRFDIWLYHHAEASSVPAVRSTVAWLHDAFDPALYPWFRDDFVHPDDLPARERSES